MDYPTSHQLCRLDEVVIWFIKGWSSQSGRENMAVHENILQSLSWLTTAYIFPTARQINQSSVNEKLTNGYL